MEKYKYYQLKKLEKLPEDVNEEYENEAINVYKSKNLLAGLKNIREKKTYTKKGDGAHLVNTRVFKILCYVESHHGVVKDMTVNRFIVHKNKAKDMKGLWNDEDTEFVIPSSKRNSNVDWFVPKTEK